jgi:hypothetical protein
MKKIIIIALFLLTPFLAFGATYTVTQDGSGADYSIATFNALTGTEYAGDTFFFSGSLTSTIQPQISGTAGGGYVTLDGYQAGDCDPINSECTSSASSTATTSWIKLTTQDYIIIQDFRASGGQLDLNGTSTSNDSSYIIIRRNELHDLPGTSSQSQGINIDYGDYITIGGAFGDGNEMYDISVNTSAGVDIVAYRTEDLIISYNHLYATKSNGDSNDRGIDGIATEYVSKLLIEYNTIHSHNSKYGSNLGEDGIDLKRETNDAIVRFNRIYDHQGQTNITIQGGSYNVYIYGNLLYDTRTGILLYARDSEYHTLENVYIWSNIINNGSDQGIAVITGGDVVGNNYVYNNTIAHNGYDYTDLYGNPQTANTYDTGFKTLTGVTYIKNNIFYKNHPEDTDYVHARASATNEVGALEHNTYYWPSQTSYFYYDGAARTIATLQGTYNLEDDIIAGEDADPGFNDADGTDNTYGNLDDDYTLDGTNINDGEDLSQCFNVTIQGELKNFCLEDGLDPTTTNWTTIPPTVAIIKQGSQGADWERGAYVYYEGTAPPEYNTGVIAANGTTLTVTFDTDAYQGSDWQNQDGNADCDEAGNDVPITYVSGHGSSTWVFTLGTTILSEAEGDTNCNFDMIDGTDAIVNSEDASMAVLTDGAITNNSTQIAGASIQTFGSVGSGNQDIGNIGSGNQTITVGE